MAKPKVVKLTNPIEVHFNVISPYHYYFFTFIFLSKIPILWQLLSLLFISPRMDFYCEDPVWNSSNLSKNACPCENPRWDTSIFSQTLHTKYNTHCDRAWLIEMSQSMIYLGTLFGSLVFGFLSDKFGRLSMFCLTLFIMAMFGCVVIVMPTMASYIFIRTLEGFGIGGAIVTAYVLCIEYCGVKQRELVTALFHIPLNIGHMTLPGISYLLRDCDDFQLAVSVPLFFFALLKFILYESPKWLMDSNQIDQAATVMEKISKFNKTTYGEIKAEMEAYQADNALKDEKKLQFWHIFRHKHLTINFVCMSFIYFVCGMGYYGVSQYIGQMSGNIHVNVAVSGAALIPGTLSTIFLLVILGRRTFLMASSFLSGVLMIIVVLIPPDNVWPRLIVACVCNCAFFVSFIIVFLYGVELFPTPVRNSALGVLSVMSRVGQIVAPLINSLSETASGTIFGTLAIVGGILCIPLPETKNTELPSSLEQSKNIIRKVSNVDPNLGINIAK